MRVPALSFALLMISSQAFCQHYGVIGAGATLSFYNSDELDNFALTYNLVNGENMRELLGGFNGYEGLRFDGGYRYLGKKFAGAILAGWQRLTRRSDASFLNGDNRRFTVKSDAFFLEGEAARLWGNFFAGGLVNFSFSRGQSIESTYTSVSGLDYIERLDGTYEANSVFSADLGVALGLRYNRMFVVGKVSYPIFSTNESDLLRDASAEKIAEQSDIFPEDYFKFFEAEPYDGVPNTLNGWKVSVTFAYAFVLAL